MATPTLTTEGECALAKVLDHAMTLAEEAAQEPDYHRRRQLEAEARLWWKAARHMRQAKSWPGLKCEGLNMTSKDYVAIAKAIAAQRNGSALLDSHLDALAKDLCKYLKRDNPAFDRSRFLCACGVS
jgi:hypothetical protein